MDAPTTGVLTVKAGSTMIVLSEVTGEHGEVALVVKRKVTVPE